MNTAVISNSNNLCLSVKQTQNQQAVTQDSNGTMECKASKQPNITQRLARV